MDVGLNGRAQLRGATWSRRSSGGAPLGAPHRLVQARGICPRAGRNPGGHASALEGSGRRSPSIGRVATSPKVRGAGLGRRLFAEGLARCMAAWPGQGIRISAQAHLNSFYAGFGFEPVGAIYLEDNIPHLEMLRPAEGRRT